MNKLQKFLATPAPSLDLQIKFLKEGRRSANDSLFGQQYPTKPGILIVRESDRVQRLPESIWMLAHKIVAFTQSHVQQSGWNSGLLNWLFVTEPWWTLGPRDYARYADLFSKAEWFDAMETISISHRNLQTHTAIRKPAPEKQAVLGFLFESRQFAEAMYRRL